MDTMNQTGRGPAVPVGAPTALNRPSARTLGELVRELARSYPLGTAVTHTTGSLDFAELDEQADAVAAGLIAVGVGRGDVVAILAPNQPEWLVIAVGAGRIGAVIAPLNTWYKDDEIRYALEHSGAAILFSVDHVRNQDIHELVGRVFPAIHSEKIPLLRDSVLPELKAIVEFGPRRHRGAQSWDEFLSRGAQSRAEVPVAEQEVNPTDDLLIVYTSGSTARPKGVLLQHGHCIENAYSIGARQGLMPSDRTWMVQPLFWALASVNMLLSAWTHGSSVVLQTVFDAGEALEIIERYQVTRAYAIGNISQALVMHPNFADADLNSLTKGVSLFSPADRRMAYHDLGMTHFVSLYGSTENHGACFSAHWRDPLDARMADNGTLLDGWESKLVIPGTDEPVAANVDTGELIVRGHLSSGYFKDPGQTALAYDGEGYFHTGDLVRIDKQGRLEFISRFTDIIKTGGINVAPAEVEEILSRHPDLRQAYVLGMPDPVKGEVVVAVVEARGAVDEASVRSWVAERAASYKIPSYVLFITDERIPRLPNGKVAKKQLRNLVSHELSEWLDTVPDI